MGEVNSNYERVLPLLWPASQLQLSTDEKPDGLVTRDMGNGLVVNYVLGEIGQLQYLRESDLSKVRMTRDELHACAIQNLTEAARRSPVEMVHQQGGSFAAIWVGEDHWSEAALLLVDDLWDKTLRTHAPDGFIAAIPRPDVLIFCNAGDTAGLVELRATAAKAFHSETITKALFRRDGLSWRRFSD